MPPKCLDWRLVNTWHLVSWCIRCINHNNRAIKMNKSDLFREMHLLLWGRRQHLRLHRPPLIHHSHSTNLNWAVSINWVQWTKVSCNSLSRMLFSCFICFYFQDHIIQIVRQRSQLHHWNQINRYHRIHLRRLYMIATNIVQLIVKCINFKHLGSVKRYKHPQCHIVA